MVSIEQFLKKMGEFFFEQDTTIFSNRNQMQIRLISPKLLAWKLPGVEWSCRFFEELFDGLPSMVKLIEFLRGRRKRQPLKDTITQYLFVGFDTNSESSVETNKTSFSYSYSPERALALFRPISYERCEEKWK